MCRLQSGCSGFSPEQSHKGKGNPKHVQVWCLFCSVINARGMCNTMLHSSNPQLAQTGWHHLLVFSYFSNWLLIIPLVLLTDWIFSLFLLICKCIFAYLGRPPMGKPQFCLWEEGLVLSCLLVHPKACTFSTSVPSHTAANGRQVCFRSLGESHVLVGALGVWIPHQQCSVFW